MSQLLKKVGLEEVRFVSRIGYFSEEHKIKNEFIVSLWVENEVDDDKLSNDLLEDTIDYTVLYEICKVHFRRGSKLIETVADKVIKDILIKYPYAGRVYIKIKKLTPPIQGEIGQSFIELTYCKK